MKQMGRIFTDKTNGTLNTQINRLLLINTGYVLHAFLQSSFNCSSADNYWLFHQPLLSK